MEPKAERPTLWMAIGGVATVIAVVAIVWALTLRSDRDEAQASAERAQAAVVAERGQLSDGERRAAAQEAKEQAFGEQALRRFRAVRGKFVKERSRADDLVADVDQETRELTQAQGAEQSVRGQLAAVQARADLAGACARGVVAVMDKFFEAEDVQRASDRALSHLEQLQDKCREAVSQT